MFRVERSPEHGGPTTFTSFADVRAAFAKGELHPGDLKAATESALSVLLATIRSQLAEKKGKLQSLIAKAYPPATDSKSHPPISFIETAIETLNSFCS